jgi:hypothetical protein
MPNRHNHAIETLHQIRFDPYNLPSGSNEYAQPLTLDPQSLIPNQSMSLPNNKRLTDYASCAG